MKPFTYLIYCTATNQYYYGSRYGKNSEPNSLWTTYYTSSKIIKQLILEHGKDAFIVSIRKKFNTPQEARRWESRFLNRVKAAQSDRWINQHNGGEKFYGKGHHGNKGKPLSEERKKKIGDSQRGQKRPNLSDYTKQKISKSRTGKTHSTETKLKMSKTRKGVTKTLKQVTCPHCGKSGKGGNMTRYHFDKCSTLLP